jgi:hypothetical protein
MCSEESGLDESGDSLEGASRELLEAWLSELPRGHADPLAHLFEFSKRRLMERDGFVPSFGSSRRASLDPAKDDVIREIARGLRKEKSDFVASFIKEWIDSSDDPHGMILETPQPSSIASSSAVNAVELDRLLAWEVDHLGLSGNELVSRSVQIFALWGFFEGEGLVVARDKFGAFTRAVAKNYRSENPYHNMHHAHSVLAASGNLLRTCGGSRIFSDLEEFSILTAAMCHDVGHRGLNSDYYIKTRHELALQYNDISVLENMHCSLSFDLLRAPANDFTANWPEEQWTTFRRIFIQCVLATDMKMHFDLTAKVTTELNKGPETLASAEGKRVLYQTLVHAADLSNPVMPTKACYQWAFRVVEEMYEQGRLEERDGYQVAPFMRHPPTNVVEFAKLQVSFVGFIVAPLWRSLAAIWPALDDRVAQMDKNLKFWESVRDNAIVRVDSGQ